VNGKRPGPGSAPPPFPVLLDRPPEKSPLGPGLMSTPSANGGRCPDSKKFPPGRTPTSPVLPRFSGEFGLGGFWNPCPAHGESAARRARSSRALSSACPSSWSRFAGPCCWIAQGIINLPSPRQRGPGYREKSRKPTRIQRPSAQLRSPEQEQPAWDRRIPSPRHRRPAGPDCLSFFSLGTSAPPDRWAWPCRSRGTVLP